MFLKKYPETVLLAVLAGLFFLINATLWPGPRVPLLQPGSASGQVQEEAVQLLSGSGLGGY